MIFDFIDWLYKVVLCFTICDSIIYFFRNIKEEIKTEESECHDSTLDTYESRMIYKIKRVIVRLSGCVILFIMLFVVNKIPMTFAFVVLSCIYVYNFYQSLFNLGSAKKIVLGNESGDMNLNEHNLFLFYIWGGICLYSSRIPQLVYTIACNFPNLIISNALVSALIILTIWAWVFILCSVSVSPTKHLLCFIISKTHLGIFRSLDHKIQKMNCKIQNLNFKFTYLIVIGEYIRSFGVRKLISIVKLIGCIVFDVLSIVKCIFCSLVWFIFLIILQIVNKILIDIRMLIDKIIEISERRVVSISFKAASIVSLCTTVAINRHDSFLRGESVSTDVFEFMASVIVIPIFINWFTEFFNRLKEPV